MDGFTVYILLAIVIGIGALLGKFASTLFSSDITNSPKDISPQHKEISAQNDSSKIEAIRQQIEKNIPAPTNKSASANKPSSLSEKTANNLIAPVETKPLTHIQEKQVVKINIEPNEVKSQAASEVVNVPKGVVVKVKRVRIVEHSVNIEWSSAITGKGEVGIKQLVSASIQGEIQRVKGYALQQIESMEYEITLDGEKHPQYQLVWMDVWLKGIAEIQEGSNSYEQPFQFRDRAELKIVPLSI
jgi:hypothetical protein